MSKFIMPQTTRDTTDILHDLLVDGRGLITQLDELQVLDERAVIWLCARISGRLDEGAFGERLRGVGRGVERAAHGALDQSASVSQKVHALARLLKADPQVPHFDQRFRALQDTLARKHPASTSAVRKYGDFAKQYPLCQAFVLALLAAAASIGTGQIVSTAVVMMMLRTGNEILRDASLSTPTPSLPAARYSP